MSPAAPNQHWARWPHQRMAWGHGRAPAEAVKLGWTLLDLGSHICFPPSAERPGEGE